MKINWDKEATEILAIIGLYSSVWMACKIMTEISTHSFTFESYKPYYFIIWLVLGRILARYLYKE